MSNFKVDPNLAAAWGISSRYVDGLGRTIDVDRCAIAKILEAVAPADGNDSYRNTYVLQRGDNRIMNFEADGGSRRWAIRSGDRTLGHGQIEDNSLLLPPDLPAGCYSLHPQEGEGGTSTLVIAPPRAYQGPDNRPVYTWVIAVQLYGVRSRQNWGHGDFTDLLMLLDYAKAYGAGGIGLNPLHVLFDDRPGHISPYSPNSRQFLNPLYIDIQRIDEFSAASKADLEPEIARLRDAEHVDYVGVRKLKFEALRRCHALFRTSANVARRADFDEFRVQSGPALRRFACFETLRRKLDGPWWHWPQQWRTPSEDALTSLFETARDEVEFYEYVQWIAERQLAVCRDRARDTHLPIGLFIDLAVGVVPDGADSWINQESMLEGVSIGAPPDSMNLRGQSWGLTTFSPIGLATAKFEPYRRMLECAMRYAGAIRIDHVLGLNRLFVVPDNMSATEGAYLDFPFDAMLAIAAEESERYHCIVIGEDLGTVPADFRAGLAEWGIWSYRVMQFERDQSGDFNLPHTYDADALVTFTTHDLPTFAGWWSGVDLNVRRKIGHDSGESEEEREWSRAALRRAVASHSESRGEKWDDSDIAGIAGFLASTPSRIVCISLEDLVGATEQPNVPGTIDEYPNWRLRTPMIHGLKAEPRLSEVSEIMRRLGRSNT